MNERSRQLARSWDANAEAWTRAVRGGAIPGRRLATDAAILAAVLGRGPRRVLDLGCGEGWLVRALAGEGIDALGVDASAPLIERALAAGAGRFEVGSYADLLASPERAGGGHDVIVFNFSLFEEDLAPLLGCLRDRLTAKGALIIQTVYPAGQPDPDKDGWRVDTFSALEGFGEPMPWYFRTQASWLEVLKKGGYRVVRSAEPAHPASDRPLSLLMVAEPMAGPAQGSDEYQE